MGMSRCIVDLLLPFSMKQYLAGVATITSGQSDFNADEGVVFTSGDALTPE